MNRKFNIVTILGSPHDKRSNTRAFVEDFVEDMQQAGLDLEHNVISLGRKTVKPCIGCWNCTKNTPCPLAADDLAEIKQAMIDSALAGHATGVVVRRHDAWSPMENMVYSSC